ncbi:unnamed protein product [Amoebophrya sp. A120]|nr:unnamed protein product [Amoebophrya sp. A120]|eukprot:GSA120T00004771001.1
MSSSSASNSRKNGATEEKDPSASPAENNGDTKKLHQQSTTTSAATASANAASHMNSSTSDLAAALGPELLRTFARAMEQLEQRIINNEQVVAEQSVRIADLAGTVATTNAFSVPIEHTRDRVGECERLIANGEETDEKLFLQLQQVTEDQQRTNFEVQKQLERQNGAIKQMEEHVERIEHELQTCVKQFQTTESSWEAHFVEHDTNIQSALRKFEFRQLQLEDDIFRHQNELLLDRAENRTWADKIRELDARLDQVESSRALSSEVHTRERKMRELIEQQAEKQSLLEQQHKLLLDDAKVLFAQSADYLLEKQKNFKSEFAKKWEELEEARAGFESRLETAEAEVRGFLAQVDGIAADTVEESRELVQELRTELCFAEQKRLKDRSVLDQKLQDVAGQLAICGRGLEEVLYRAQQEEQAGYNCVAEERPVQAGTTTTEAEEVNDERTSLDEVVPVDKRRTSAVEPDDGRYAFDARGQEDRGRQPTQFASTSWPAAEARQNAFATERSGYGSFVEAKESFEADDDGGLISGQRRKRGTNVGPRMQSVFQQPYRTTRNTAAVKKSAYNARSTNAIPHDGPMMSEYILPREHQTGRGFPSLLVSPNHVAQTVQTPPGKKSKREHPPQEAPEEAHFTPSQKQQEGQFLDSIVPSVSMVYTPSPIRRILGQHSTTNQAAPPRKTKQ